MTKASIVIITHNRPKYLKRILNYYNSCKADYKIIVSDSSSEENKIMNKEIISSFPKLDILYVGHYLDKIDDFRHQAGDSLNYVKTKYCVFCADDDFITPNGIKQSVDFLENNPDFTTAHGRYVCFYLKEKKGRKKQFCWRPGYLSESITFDKAEDRLIKHLSEYSIVTTFGAYRTDFLKMTFREMLKFTNDERFSELLPSMLALIYGKMQCLDILYSAKEMILNSAGIRNENFQDFIKEGSYNEKYTKFRECLAIHLSKNSQLDIEKSKMLIDNAMIAYLNKHDANDFEHFLINIMKYILSFLPEGAYEKIRSLYIKMRLSFLSTFSKPKDNFFNSIEDPSSKYYDDFVKIRDCVISHLI